MPLAALAASASLAAALALRGLRKRSLSRSGALAAALVGFLHMAAGLRFGGTLILFYHSSSKLTRWRDDLKRRLDATHSTGGQRDAAQALANSLLGAALAAAATWQAGGGGGGSGGSPTAAAARLATIEAAFVAFYAVCCADTWSSEVGIASKHPPRLITTGRAVPPGTNGGVSLLGTVAAAAGGLFIGCCFCIAAGAAAWWGGGVASAAMDWRLVPLALVAGLAGCLLDSLLGATLQWSGHDERSGKAVSGRPPAGSPAAKHVRHISGWDVLSNTGVNVVASTLSSGLAAVAWSAPDDPRVRSEPPSGNQPRASDPDWVDRKDPGSLPKHLPGTAEGVAYDVASNTVVGGAAEGQGGGASTTAALGAGHALGEAGSAEDRGVRGNETQWGSGGPTRIADRAEAGKEHLSTAAGAGKSVGERARAGVDQDPASALEGAPGLAGKTNWGQS